MSDDNDKDSKSGLATWLAVGAVLLGVVNLLLLVLVVPPMGVMFSDFGAVLPGPTSLMLDLSDSVKRWSFFILLAWVAGVGLLARGSSREPEPDSSAELGLGIALVVMLLLTLTIIWAMFMPIFHMGTVVSGP